ncbi:hypothetical protein AHAS_Ahas19G0177100 [Arachis hypogaea]
MYLHGSATLGHQEIDLLKIVKKATDSISCGSLGLQLPLMVRFSEILKNRLESLQSTFDYVIQSRGYGSHYQGVYPVKCNQDLFIVEDIVKFGSYCLQRIQRRRVHFPCVGCKEACLEHRDCSGVRGRA